MEGYNRIHAVLGTSQHCIATHPSDMAVAMMALDATVVVSGQSGSRRIPIGKFYLLPGTTPDRENALGPGGNYHARDIAGAVTKRKVTLLEEKRSCVVRICAGIGRGDCGTGRAEDSQGTGGMGGVGTIPWRSPEAEHELTGAEAAERAFRKAAEAALHAAKARKGNGFKIELAKRTLVRALQTVTSA